MYEYYACACYVLHLFSPLYVCCTYFPAILILQDIPHPDHIHRASISSDSDSNPTNGPPSFFRSVKAKDGRVWMDGEIGPKPYKVGISHNSVKRFRVAVQLGWCIQANVLLPNPIISGTIVAYS